MQFAARAAPKPTSRSRHIIPASRLSTQITWASPPRSRDSVITSCSWPFCLAPALVSAPTPTLPLSLYPLSFPHKAALAGGFIIGKEKEKGDGDECGGQESMKGKREERERERGVGGGSNGREGKLLCVCVGGNSASPSPPLTDPMSVPLIPSRAKGGLIFSLLWRCNALHRVRIPAAASFI